MIASLDIPTFRAWGRKLKQAVTSGAADASMGPAPVTRRAAISSGYVTPISGRYGRRGRFAARAGTGPEYDCLELSALARGIIDQHGNNLAKMMPFRVLDGAGEVQPDHRLAAVLRSWHRYQTAPAAAKLAVQLYYETGSAPTLCLRPTTPAEPRPTLSTDQSSRLAVTPTMLQVLAEHDIETWHDAAPGAAPPRWPTAYAYCSYTYNSAGIKVPSQYYTILAKGGGVTDRIPIADLALWESPDRYGGLDPVPPIDAIRLWVDLDAHTAHWMLDSVENGMRVDYEVELPASPDEASEIRASVAARHQGRPGGMLDVGKFLSAKPVNLGPKEADWLNTREKIAETIALALNYPPYLLLTKFSSESNVKNGKAELYEHAYGLGLQWGQSLAARLFTEQERANGYKLVPDTSNIAELQDDRSEMAATMAQWVALGYPLDQVATMFGVEPPSSIAPDDETDT